MRPPDSTQLFTTTYEFNCADRPLFVALRCQLVPAHRLEPEDVERLEHAVAFAVQVAGAFSGAGALLAAESFLRGSRSS